MEQMLMNLKNKSVLCEIYNNLNAVDEFYVGYIICFDDEMLVLESVTPQGEFDGFYCILIDSILTIKYNTIYTHNIQKLMEHNNFVFKTINFDERTLIESVLKYIYTNNHICDVDLFENSCSLTGYIDLIDDNTIILNLVNENGALDGVGIARINDISCVALETEDLKKLEIFKS